MRLNVTLYVLSFARRCLISITITEICLSTYAVKQRTIAAIVIKQIKSCCIRTFPTSTHNICFSLRGLINVNVWAPSQITRVLPDKIIYAKLFICFPNLPLNLKQGFSSYVLRNENRVAMAIYEDIPNYVHMINLHFTTELFARGKHTLDYVGRDGRMQGMEQNHILHTANCVASHTHQ
jgi:hypothetical protein